MKALSSCTRLLTLALSLLVIVACNKVPIRKDIQLKLIEVDGQPISNQQASFQFQSGQTHTFKFSFSSESPLEEVYVGLEQNETLNDYVTGLPEKGATSGTFTFNFDVDALIPEPVNGGLPPTRILRVSMYSESGMFVNRGNTVQKTQ